MKNIYSFIKKYIIESIISENAKNYKIQNKLQIQIINCFANDLLVIKSQFG